MSFTEPIFTKFTNIQHRVEILYTDFHLSQSRNVENMAINLFMPLRKFLLLYFVYFQENLGLIDKFF
jgi:hypothetical protein